MKGTAKAVNQDVFRAYDIRGIYPSDINEELAESVGRALGKFMGKPKKVLVGMDVRVSSPALVKRLIEGILSQDLEILYAGIIPTPVLYFAISHYKLDGGISVTASHNPPEWNGFKICKEDAHVIGLGSGLEKIRDLINSGSLGGNGSGIMEDRSGSITNEYLEFVSGKIGMLNGLKVGIDPGNGAYSIIAAETFRKKGAEVFPINDTPDGRFPSRSPEPKESTVSGLMELVRSRGLDMGIAFDGDGDRVLFVTDTGSVISIDTVLALLVKAYLKKGEKVAYEVSVSSAVEDAVREKEGIPILSKVGHSHLKDHMKYENCRFGGEISGHMYFQEVYGGDDALFAALKVAELLVKSGKSLSELGAGMPRYVKASEELRAADSKKFRAMDMIAARLSEDKRNRIVTVDGIKVITPKGWYVLRVSNTTSCIRCTAEARNEKDLKELLETARGEFSRAYNKL